MSIEKIDLLDTEYAQLLDLEIDKQKYLEDESVSSSSKTLLTRLKVEIASASLVMLLGTGFLAFFLLNFEPRRANNDVTTELKARGKTNTGNASPTIAKAGAEIILPVIW